jgi:hypothetical protein
MSSSDVRAGFAHQRIENSGKTSKAMAGALAAVLGTTVTSATKHRRPEIDERDTATLRLN